MSESINPINQSLIAGRRSSTTSELEDQYHFQCNRLVNTIVGRETEAYARRDLCAGYGGMTLGSSGCCWEKYHCESDQICCRNHNPEVQGVCIDEVSFYIELRRPLSAGTESDKHHLHIAEIEAYDDDDNKCTLTYANRASPLVKLGATWAGRQLSPAEALDGNHATVTHNEWSWGRENYGKEDHYMEFETDCNSISKVRIYNRPDGQRRRLVGSVLYLMNNHGEVITQHTFTQTEVVTIGSKNGDIIDWQTNYQDLTEFKRNIACGGNGSGRDSDCDATKGGGLDCCRQSVKDKDLKYMIWYGQQCWGSADCGGDGNNAFYDLVSASVWESGYSD